MDQCQNPPKFVAESWSIVPSLFQHSIRDREHATSFDGEGPPAKSAMGPREGVVTESDTEMQGHPMKWSTLALLVSAGIVGVILAIWGIRRWRKGTAGIALLLFVSGPWANCDVARSDPAPRRRGPEYRYNCAVNVGYVVLSLLGQRTASQEVG